MRVGFYYHIPVSINSEGKIGMPAFLGLFIDSIADRVGELILFMHVVDETDQQEYFLKSLNVRIVSLGKPKPAYLRFFLPSLFLKKVALQLNECDYLIVRSPSPLAPAFPHYLNSKKLIYMIVGSYKEGVKFLVLPWYKALPVKILNRWMHASLGKSLPLSRVLVNSEALYNEYKTKTTAIARIYTTTLTRQDFFQSFDACSRTTIKLLYVGRIDLAKGLKECIAACAFLKGQGISVSLTIVGWEESGNQVTRILADLAQKEGVGSLINFAGRKKAGPELLNFYRTHDIFLLPSYHEGFPRTIWEALANSIPVVTTTVGSIPAFIKNEREALLVSPRNQEELNAAALRIIKEENLRKHLIENGFARVQEILLDVQSERIINFIKS